MVPDRGIFFLLVCFLEEITGLVQVQSIAGYETWLTEKVFWQ